MELEGTASFEVTDYPLNDTDLYSGDDSGSAEFEINYNGLLTIFLVVRGTVCPNYNLHYLICEFPTEKGLNDYVRDLYKVVFIAVGDRMFLEMQNFDFAQI